MGQTAGLNSILRSTLAKIDEQIHVLQNQAVRFNKEAEDRGEESPNFNEYDIVTPDMHHEMIPLLLARSNVLLAIAIDNNQR